MFLKPLRLASDECVLKRVCLKPINIESNHVARADLCVVYHHLISGSSAAERYAPHDHISLLEILQLRRTLLLLLVDKINFLHSFITRP
jgi:hypothetical protein